MKKLIFILIFSINMSLADKVLTEDNIKSCIQYYNYKDIDAFSIMCIDNTAYLSKNGLLKMKNEKNEIVHCYCKKNSFFNRNNVVLKE